MKYFINEDINDDKIVVNDKEYKAIDNFNIVDDVETSHAFLNHDLDNTVSLSEKWMSREEIITELKKLRRTAYYNFDRFTTAQLYHILQRELSHQADIEEKEATAYNMFRTWDEAEDRKCPICGTQLNDSDKCPICDEENFDYLDEGVANIGTDINLPLITDDLEYFIQENNLDAIQEPFDFNTIEIHFGDGSSARLDIFNNVNGPYRLIYEGKKYKFSDRRSLYSLISQIAHNHESLSEAIEKHDVLNPDLWENNEIKPEVREKLLEIVQKFDDNLKENGIELDVKDVVIIGSNANYNYTEHSDIDTHIVADMSPYKNEKDLAMKLYEAYKCLFNNKYDPTIYGHEVEIYVEPEQIRANSNGMYSLNTGWLKEPVQSNIPDVDENELNNGVAEFEDRIELAETIEDINNIIDSLYLLRQQSILRDGEFGIGNQVFKEIRNMGLLQELKDKKVALENKEMSLESICERCK